MERSPEVAATRRAVAWVMRGIGGIGLLLAAAGCADQGTTQTGFLTNYSQMHPVEGHTRDLIYVKPGYSRAQYNSVIIDPVVWQPSEDAPQLSEKQVARITEAFRTELAGELKPVLHVVDANFCGDCAGVIRVRAAVTNLRLSKWYYNAIPMVIGFGAAAAGGMLPPIPPPAPGGASEELVAVDAKTGEVLASIATYNNGMPWNALGQFLPYAHAERAFKLASQLMDEQLMTNGDLHVTSR